MSGVFAIDARRYVELAETVISGNLFASPGWNTHMVVYRELKNPAASCRESSTVRNSVNFLIRSLTPQQAAGNALAFAVQPDTKARCSLLVARCWLLVTGYSLLVWRFMKTFTLSLRGAKRQSNLNDVVTFNPSIPSIPAFQHSSIPFLLIEDSL